MRQDFVCGRTSRSKLLKKAKLLINDLSIHAYQRTQFRYLSSKLSLKKSFVIFIQFEKDNFFSLKLTKVKGLYNEEAEVYLLAPLTLIR
jgi:hypothetical protein